MGFDRGSDDLAPFHGVNNGERSVHAAAPPRRTA
jgi:hypothetical protein